jgi:hypothetical protein
MNYPLVNYILYFIHGSMSREISEILEFATDFADLPREMAAAPISWGKSGFWGHRGPDKARRAKAKGKIATDKL